MESRKSIAILGSTGSIGTQALDIISKRPDLFKAEVLTANHNIELLIEQALRFKPSVVVIANKALASQLKRALDGQPTEVLAGEEALLDVAALPQVNLVLTSMVGYAGLRPTLHAIKAGKDIALANKETLVVAGELIMESARAHGVRILPVDSEHSAIFQCLRGEEPSSVKSLILTASGGPFRTRTKEQLQYVTCREALAHPNWNMGAKVTIDSASLMNKGLEMIEARWLFDIVPEKIQVVIHPQSIIHSMVEFHDGSVKAQIGLPDMRFPILHAFSYPHRPSAELPALDFTRCAPLTFELPDRERFPNLRLAEEALAKGGNCPCGLNSANETVVRAFLEEKIAFLQMPELIERVMDRLSFISSPSITDYEETHLEAGRLAESFLKKMAR